MMTLNFEAGYMHAVFPHATTRRFLAARAGSIYAPLLRTVENTKFYFSLHPRFQRGLGVTCPRVAAAFAGHNVISDTDGMGISKSNST